MLLVASYVFYGSWDWRFLFLIALSTCVDFFVGSRMFQHPDDRVRRRLLFVSLATNLSLLGVFKYFNFFSDSFAALMAGLGLQVNTMTLEVILPVGISFYTFQTLSYTIDIYRKQLEPEENFTNFALFVAFFPQLVAGPIERASRLLPQIRSRRTLTRQGVQSGLWMIFWGFFLKLFMADNLAGMVESVYGAESAQSGVSIWLASYGFAYQVLGDFAGYSFIATGLASLLGIHLTTNFLFPFFATSVAGIWRNWHITLSTWLRDYLYISLGGGRGRTLRVYLNLMLTMSLGGLWHGAAWNYVVWGVFNGFLLAGDRALEPYMKAVLRPLEGLSSRLVTFIRVSVVFHLFILGLVWFRSQSLGHAVEFFREMFFGLGMPSQSEWVAGSELAFYCWLAVAVLLLQQRNREVRSIDGIPTSLRVPLIVLMVYSLVVWGNYRGTEFIYFQF
jgi:D-alanyl-lipoteichoic acid acyltransferase DltB (MBOAT superfamily)